MTDHTNKKPVEWTLFSLYLRRTFKFYWNWIRPIRQLIMVTLVIVLLYTPSIYDYLKGHYEISLMLLFLDITFIIASPLWRIVMARWHFPSSLSSVDTLYLELFPINFNKYISLLNLIRMAQLAIISMISTLLFIFLSHLTITHIHVEISYNVLVDIAILNVLSVVVSRWIFSGTWSLIRTLSSAIWGLTFLLVTWEIFINISHVTIPLFYQVISSLLLLSLCVLICINMYGGQENDGKHYLRWIKEADRKRSNLTARMLLMKPPRNTVIPKWRLKIRISERGNPFSWRYLIRVIRIPGNVKPFMYLFGLYSLGLQMFVHSPPVSDTNLIHYQYFIRMGVLLLFSMGSTLSALFFADIWQAEWFESDLCSLFPLTQEALIDQFKKGPRLLSGTYSSLLWIMSVIVAHLYQSPITFYTLAILGVALSFALSDVVAFYRLRYLIDPTLSYIRVYFIVSFGYLEMLILRSSMTVTLISWILIIVLSTFQRKRYG